MAETPMNRSARRNVISAFKDAAAVVHNGRYRVKRGFVNYATFPYDKHPYALAVRIAQEAFIATAQQAESTATHAMEMELEFTKLLADQSEDPSVDEDFLDECYEDAQEIVRQVMKRKDVVGDDVAVHVIGREADPMLSLDLGIQGLTVGLRVDW